MRQTENALIAALGVLFLLSGACALVYQVAWQRILPAHPCAPSISAVL
jgi:hypothetical protein